MNKSIKFRLWNGHSMEYNVLAGASGIFYVEGLGSKDWVTVVNFSENTPVMQFTGLLDKNGKEIYEGDIILITGRKTYVFFRNGSFMYWIDSQSYLELSQSYSLDDIKVIGNIYQNPELLK
jgi:hypothetical protein